MYFHAAGMAIRRGFLQFFKIKIARVPARIQLLPTEIDGVRPAADRGDERVIGSRRR